MKSAATVLYSKSELLTRRAVFSRITGGCTRFAEAESRDFMQADTVFLNFDRRLQAASDAFERLMKKKRNIIIYSDVLMHPLFISRIRLYERCSLIICPEEYEIEKAADAINMEKPYITIAARKCITDTVPVGPEGFCKLTRMQLIAACCILCGMPYKAMTVEMGTTEKVAANTVARLRQMFSRSSNEELCRYFSLAF